MNSKLLFLLLLILLFVVYNFIKKKEYFSPSYFSPGMVPGISEEESYQTTVGNLVTSALAVEPVNDNNIEEEIILNLSEIPLEDVGEETQTQIISLERPERSDFFIQTERALEGVYGPSPSMTDELFLSLPPGETSTFLSTAAHSYRKGMKLELNMAPSSEYPSAKSPKRELVEYYDYPLKFERNKKFLKIFPNGGAIRDQIFSLEEKSFDKEINLNILDTPVKAQLHRLNNLKSNFKLLKKLLYTDKNDPEYTNIEYSQNEKDKLINIFKLSELDYYLNESIHLYYPFFPIIFSKSIDDETSTFRLDRKWGSIIDLSKDFEEKDFNGQPGLFKFLQGNSDFFKYIRENYNLKDILKIFIDENFLLYGIILKNNFNQSIQGDGDFVDFNLDITIDYFYIPFSNYHFDKSKLKMIDIMTNNKVNKCYRIIWDYLYYDENIKMDFFTIMDIIFKMRNDNQQKKYINLIILLKLIFKNKNTLIKKNAEHLKHRDITINLENYRDKKIIETQDYLTFNNLTTLNYISLILKDWELYNIKNVDILKIIFGFQEKATINEKIIKDYRNIYTNDKTKISKPLTSIPLNGKNFDFYIYNFSRDLKINSYFFNSGIKYTDTEINKLADSILKYLNNKEMSVADFRKFFEIYSTDYLVAEIFSNKTHTTLPNSLILQKKEGSNTIFRITGYDLYFDINDNIDKIFEKSHFDKYIIQKIRKFIGNLSYIIEYIKKNYIIENINLIIIDGFKYNFSIFKNTELKYVINEDKSIDFKLNYSLDVFNIPFRDFKLNTKFLRAQLLSISEFYDKKSLFIDKIISNRIDYIWNKIEQLVERNNTEEKEELNKFKGMESSFNKLHKEFIKSLEELYPDKGATNEIEYHRHIKIKIFNLQIKFLADIFKDGKELREFLDYIIETINYTPEEYKNDYRFLTNPKFFNYKTTKIKDEELFLEFMLEHSLADSVIHELEIFKLKKKAEVIPNFKEYKKDRCKNKELDGSISWVDNEIISGWSCLDYQKYGVCGEGKVIDSGNKLLDLSTNFGDLTARQACCVCGGGIDESELIKTVEGKTKIKLKIEEVEYQEMTEKNIETLIDEIVREFNQESEYKIGPKDVTVVPGSIIILITIPETQNQTESIKIVEKANSIEVNIPTRVGVVTSKPKVELDSKLVKVVEAAKTHQSTQTRSITNNNNNNNVEPQPCSDEKEFAEIMKMYGEGVYQFKAQDTSNIFLPNIVMN